MRSAEREKLRAELMECFRATIVMEPDWKLEQPDVYARVGNWGKGTAKFRAILGGNNKWNGLVEITTPRAFCQISNCVYSAWLRPKETKEAAMLALNQRIAELTAQIGHPPIQISRDCTVDSGGRAG